MTMLEKAARAASTAFHTEGGDAANDLDWTEVARAALMAVREPNEALTLRAGWLSCDYSSEFTAMIDAILNEESAK